MSDITLEAQRLRGRLIPPPDKSISHRAIIIGSLAQGRTEVKNLSVCQDCLHTINAFKSMGISISKRRGNFIIQGQGLKGLRRPTRGKLFLGNSGTSMRLILGVLAGQQFKCTLSGDASLSQRPMKRVILPLSLMGAKIKARQEKGEQFPPLTVCGGKLSSICYPSPIASAQVKSAILFAGLFARGMTTVTEPAKSRDHTERMLKRFGAQIGVKGLKVQVEGVSKLHARYVDVPGDISAASFFLVGACISPGSEVEVEAVGLNPTRTAFLHLLQKMGAQLSINLNKHRAGKDYQEELQGKVRARASQLKGITITPKQIPALIDELPVLMVAATQAEGRTIIQGAGELRVKETDRIRAMVSNLARMGADIASSNDDVIIRGPVKLAGCPVDSFGDHRVAMSMAVAALVARRHTTIKGIECVRVSYPQFFKTLSELLS